MTKGELENKVGKAEARSGIAKGKYTCKIDKFGDKVYKKTNIVASDKVFGRQVVLKRSERAIDDDEEDVASFKLTKMLDAFDGTGLLGRVIGMKALRDEGGPLAVQHGGIGDDELDDGNGGPTPPTDINRSSLLKIAIQIMQVSAMHKSKAFSGVQSEFMQVKHNLAKFRTELNKCTSQLAKGDKPKVGAWSKMIA